MHCIGYCGWGRLNNYYRIGLIQKIVIQEIKNARQSSTRVGEKANTIL
jgi:hypothetical protein